MSLVLFLMPILLYGGVRNVVIFGPPGVGKGTQSKHIAERWGLCHVSTGDLLRAEVASGSRRSKRLAADMKNGVLVPDRVLLRLVRQALDGEKCQSNGWLLDGFPRTEAQALAMVRSGLVPHEILVLNASAAVAAARVLQRAAAARRAGGAVRADDTEAAVATRLQAYTATQRGVIGALTSFLRVHVIDGERAVAQVSGAIDAALEGG